MNCFQKCIFDLLETTYRARSISRDQLWIAFKNVSLTYWKQPIACRYSMFTCCELLSKMYLWPIGNNLRKQKNSLIRVVNCFQKCIFDLLETTICLSLMPQYWLWIAFKNVSLTYWKQQLAIQKTSEDCCELLSKMYLWPIGNNFGFVNHVSLQVVNCFQKCIFDLLETT